MVGNGLLGTFPWCSYSSSSLYSACGPQRVPLHVFAPLGSGTGSAGWCSLARSGGRGRSDPVWFLSNPSLTQALCIRVQGVALCSDSDPCVAAKLCLVPLVGLVWSCHSPSSKAPPVALIQGGFLPLHQGERDVSSSFPSSSVGPHLYPGVARFAVLPPAVWGFWSLRERSWVVPCAFPPGSSCPSPQLEAFSDVLPSVHSCEHLLELRRALESTKSTCQGHWPILGFEKFIKNLSAFSFLACLVHLSLLWGLPQVNLGSSSVSSYISGFLAAVQLQLSYSFKKIEVSYFILPFLVIARAGVMLFPAVCIPVKSPSILFDWFIFFINFHSFGHFHSFSLCFNYIFSLCLLIFNNVN